MEEKKFEPAFIRLECEGCGAQPELVDKKHAVCKHCGKKYLIDEANGRLVLEVNVNYTGEDPGTVKKVMLIIGFFPLVAALVGIGIWNYNHSDNKFAQKTTEPVQESSASDSAVSENKVIQITEENGLTCVYTENSLADVSEVIALEDIEVLHMEGFYDVHYLDGMENCVNLKELSVEANLEYAEVALDMNLFAQNTRLEKLTLKAGNQKYLHLEAMGNLTNLKEFYLEWITLEDCTFLDKLINLECLSIKAPDYFDAGFLQNMPKLKALHLSGGGYLSAEDIAYIPNVEELTVKLDSAAALEAVAGLTKLRRLDLTINDDLEEKWIHNITDISVLSKLPALESLTIEGSAFTSVEVVFAMPTLQELSIGFFEVDPEKLQVNETMKKVYFTLGLPKKYDTREYISDKVFLKVFPNVTVLKVE